MKIYLINENNIVIVSIIGYVPSICFMRTKEVIDNAGKRHNVLECLQKFYFLSQWDPLCKPILAWHSLLYYLSIDTFYCHL